MNTFKYFAYGSNMSCRRLKKRVCSAQVIGTGVLYKHCLTFHKASKDGSGKCTIERSESNKVYGVLFEINKEQEKKLDKVEGLCKGYTDITVEIEIRESKKYDCGEIICAKTYQGTNLDRKRKPYTWYKRHVLVGAKETNLPQCYIDCLENVDTDKDPCKKREACELAIYSC